ncbi:MAG: MFS transporter [Thermoplasmatales archaeon]
MPFSERARSTIVIMALMGTLVNYVETMVVPALPVLSKFFDSPYSSLSWVLTAYLISGTVSAAIFGKLADIVGKKKVFVILAIIYSVAVSFGGFATSLSEFITIRAIQGLGMGMFPVAFALLNDELPPKELPLAQGIISATFIVGASVGLVIGAWITQNFDWQWSYHSAIPVAFGLLIASFVILKESNIRKKERIDFGGVALVVTGIVSLLLLLSQGEYWGWSSSAVLALALLSITSFVLFYFYERGESEPFIDLKLLSVRNIFLANFAGLFVSGGMFYLFYTIPTLLEDPYPLGFGKDVFTAGLTVVPGAILGMVVAPIAAAIIRRRGPKLAILIGTFIMLLAFLLLYFNRSTPIAITEDAGFIGAGTAFVFVGMINMIIISTPKESAGMSTGMNTVFRNIGSSLAPAISGSIESQMVAPALVSVIPLPMGSLPYVPVFENFPSQESFNVIYIIGFVTLLVSLIFSLSMKKVIVNEKNEVV